MEYFAKLTTGIVARRCNDDHCNADNNNNIAHMSKLAQKQSKRDDLLEFMISADHNGKKLTDKQIADNGVLMFFAGSDTR